MPKAPEHGGGEEGGAGGENDPEVPGGEIPGVPEMPEVPLVPADNPQPDGRPDGNWNSVKYYELSPEVPANFHGGTWDDSLTPPRVTSVKLGFEFPLRSEIITAIEAYVVTAELAEALRATDFTGFRFGPVTETRIESWSEYADQIVIPPLECLIVVGAPLVDDFGLQRLSRLVASERAARWLVARDPNLRESTAELDDQGKDIDLGHPLPEVTS